MVIIFRAVIFKRSFFRISSETLSISQKYNHQTRIYYFLLMWCFRWTGRRGREGMRYHLQDKKGGSWIVDQDFQTSASKY